VIDEDVDGVGEMDFLDDAHMAGCRVPMDDGGNWTGRG